MRINLRMLIQGYKAYVLRNIHPYPTRQMRRIQWNNLNI